MRDLDSAVGRLDNILMSVYVIVAALIIAVTLVGSDLFTSMPGEFTVCFFLFRKHNLPLWSQEREL